MSAIRFSKICAQPKRVKSKSLISSFINGVELMLGARFDISEIVVVLAVVERVGYYGIGCFGLVLNGGCCDF